MIDRACGCTHGVEKHEFKKTETSKWRGKCSVESCECKRYRWDKDAGKKIQDDVTSPPVAASN
jgi:homogentisate 1,2-dioxygenase